MSILLTDSRQLSPSIRKQPIEILALRLVPLPKFMISYAYSMHELVFPIRMYRVIKWKSNRLSKLLQPLWQCHKAPKLTVWHPLYVAEKDIIESSLIKL